MHVPLVAAIRPQLEVLAQAPVPTKHGLFQMSVFHWGGVTDAWATPHSKELGPGQEIVGALSSTTFT